MGKQIKYERPMIPNQSLSETKKEYTDFDDMKNIFQYTHRRMGLGFSEEQFGESQGVVKGISKKQLVGAQFDAKKKKELEKKKQEKEKKQILFTDKMSSNQDEKTLPSSSENTQSSNKQITKLNNSDSDDYDDSRESKTKQIPAKNKAKNFQVEIKKSKQKNKQKSYKII